METLERLLFLSFIMLYFTVFVVVTAITIIVFIIAIIVGAAIVPSLPLLSSTVVLQYIGNIAA